MGANQSSNRSNNQTSDGRSGNYLKDQIELIYDIGLRYDLSYKDMYEMDLSEIINTIEQRKKALAYRIWRLASLTRSPFIKEFPQTPEDACPELMPNKTIPMPDFLKEKYYKRKGVKINE